MEQNTMPFSHTLKNFQGEVKEEIREYLEEFAEAISRGNIEEILSFYASDVRSFDMMPPLTIQGVDQYRINWEMCFTDYFKFPVTYEFRDMKIYTDGDIAFCHALAVMKGTSLEGKDMDSTLRVTIGLQKVDGAWVIVHDHNSAPSDNDGKVLMSLKAEGESLS